ncbi:MAG: photosynthetic reaction center cytochrome PufC [Kiloniellales bacterium]
MTFHIPKFVSRFAVLVGGILVILAFFAIPISTETVQQGYRGTGKELVLNANTIERQLEASQVPAEPWPLEEGDGPLASEVYENVQVLGHLNAGNFDRLMAAMTEWVSPEQGCTYCHTEDGNFASDDIYTKVVSRRMIQMTQHVNSQWTNHVAETGVSCYTCHRGQPVPEHIWFDDPDALYAGGLIGDRAGQNIAAAEVGMTSLPQDMFRPFLHDEANIRVIGNEALPNGNERTIKQTEWTYGLMIHMSESLGVNCTYCHNSSNFGSWDQAPASRAVAWHGIRMMRDLNVSYLEPLGPVYPEIRLGPLGDAPKANCATCHQGVYKPLFGAQMVIDYPSLQQPGPANLQDPPTRQTSGLLD